MKTVDERVIYIINPMELLSNVKRAFDKSNLDVIEEEIRGLNWLLTGFNEKLRVEAKLTSEVRVIDELRIVGETYVSKLIVKASGSEESIKKFKRDLEISLLRCLG